MDKPFTTIAEQIEILHSRGLLTDENTPHTLERESYYSVINGYKDFFIDKQAKSAAMGEDRYIKGTSFNDLYRLFLFDRDLRMLLFRYFAIAEATLKTVVSYRFAEAHQDRTEAYLEKASYRQESCYSEKINAFINDLNKALCKHTENPKFKRQYIEHYVKNHDGVPIWVLSNYLMLGQAFKLYDYQQETMQNTIAKDFGNLYNQTHKNKKRFSARDVRLAYDHIKDFRNICAHDERLYCAKVSPNHGVTVLNVIDDLKLALTKEQHDKLIDEITELIKNMLHDFSEDTGKAILESMGISNVETNLKKYK